MTVTPLPVVLADGVTRTRDHWWWRPGWHVGQRAYTWHLTFEDAPELARLTEGFRAVLARYDEHDVIPERWLHLTMNGLGFVSDVTSEQAAEVAEWVAAGIDGLPGGVLTLDSLLVVDEGVLLTAQRDDWLLRLNELQRRAIDEVCGRRDWPTFWPHVSVSYTHGVQDAAALRDALAEVIIAGPIEIAHPRITLMRINRDQHCYSWDVVRQYSWPVTGAPEPRGAASG